MDERAKFIDNAKPEEFFILKNKKALKSLHELADSLTSMDDETFKHHVTKEKNDFANWIKDVFKNERLAILVSKLKTRESIINAINNWLSTVAKESGKSTEADKAKKDANLYSKELYSKDVLSRVNEILLKEKELEKREQKILEVEERIEKILFKQKGKGNKEPAFFSKEFVQGSVTGFLITLIVALIYIKFFY